MKQAKETATSKGRQEQDKKSKERKVGKNSCSLWSGNKRV